MNPPLGVFALAALLTAGCALTSKADVLDVRYFTPDAPAIGPRSVAASSGAELRLGRVVTGDGLHEKIAYSDGAHEVGYYDDRRWTERPDYYVRRALDRALFERRGLRHVVGGAAPTLDVDVISFEEIKTKGKHAVRIDLHFQVADDRAVLIEGRRAVERPVTDDKTFEAVASAMAGALDDASEAVAAAVAGALEKRSGAGATGATTSSAR